MKLFRKWIKTCEITNHILYLNELFFEIKKQISKEKDYTIYITFSIY